MKNSVRASSKAGAPGGDRFWLAAKTNVIFAYLACCAAALGGPAKNQFRAANRGV